MRAAVWLTVRVQTTNTARKPRIPAAARKAGATKIDRCCGSKFFAVGYTPGTGDAVTALLKTHFATRGFIVTIEREGMSIILETIDA